jgi:spectinomycin phosphotransferase
MRSPLERVAEQVIVDIVRAAWELPVQALRYVPEGGGAYHWIGLTDEGARWFVTCDDLDTKPWLGADRDSVFTGLLAAYGAAHELHASGLSFVVAPVPSGSGGLAERVDDRHSVSVFAHVEGQPGQWGRPISTGARAELVEKLAALHAAAPAGRQLGRRGMAVPGRQALDDAVAGAGEPWDGGPLSELARHELITHADLLGAWLAALDQLSERLDRPDAPLVVTHGEPHPGNLISPGRGLQLVDWDTIAMARPERDLWMLAEPRSSTATDYQERTGASLDPEALAGFRLLWAVTDIAAFTVQLRGRHDNGADAEGALAGLRSIFSGREPAPYG